MNAFMQSFILPSLKIFGCAKLEIYMDIHLILSGPHALVKMND